MNAKTLGLIGLLQEASWLFGSKAFDGACCEGLSYMEYQALAEMERTDDCSIQSIGRALKFTKSGATRIVDRLERKGLARRRRSPDDGRVCCVRITSRGKGVLSKITKNYSAYLEDVLQDLDLRSVEMIADSLAFLIAAARQPQSARKTNLPSA